MIIVHVCVSRRYKRLHKILRDSGGFFRMLKDAHKLQSASTYAVTAAFPSAAPHQRIAEISRPAEANGAVVSSRISALFAISIDAARIRAAQFT